MVTVQVATLSMPQRLPEEDAASAQPAHGRGRGRGKQSSEMNYGFGDSGLFSCPYGVGARYFLFVGTFVQ